MCYNTFYPAEYVNAYMSNPCIKNKTTGIVSKYYIGLLTVQLERQAYLIRFRGFYGNRFPMK